MESFIIFLIIYFLIAVSVGLYLRHRVIKKVGKFSIKDDLFPVVSLSVIWPFSVPTFFIVLSIYRENED